MLILERNKKTTSPRDSKRRWSPLSITIGVATIPVLIGVGLVAYTLIGHGVNIDFKAKLANFFNASSPIKLVAVTETNSTAVGAGDGVAIKVTAKYPAGTLPNNQLIDYQIEGEGELVSMEPLDATARFLFKAPAKPQTVTLRFTYGLARTQLQLNIFDPTPPPPPAITSPTNNSKLSSADVIVSGQTVAKAKIAILVDGKETDTAQANDQGAFAVRLKSPLTNGTHKIQAIAKMEFVQSQPNSPLTIVIDAGSPTIDAGNIVIRPRQVASGMTFDAFVPVSTNTQKVFILYDQQQFPLQDANQTSVFSGRFTAPKQPGSYQIGFSLIDRSGNATLFPKMATLTVQ